MRRVILSTVLIGLASVQSNAQGNHGPPPVNVRFGEVRLEQLARHRAVTGEIVARRRATLAGQQPGLVIEFAVEAGDRVQAGAVVARLDDEISARAVDRAQALLSAAQAVVHRREAEVSDAKSDLVRAEQLDLAGSASASEIESAQTRVRVSEAQLLEAKAEVLSERADLHAAIKRLADMRITAPFTGTVVKKRTEVGEWLGLGDPVIELVADDLLEARIDIPESVIGQLQSNEPVSITIRAIGVTVEGKILGIVPEAEELSRSFRVRIEVPARVKGAGPEGSDLIIRPGMSVTAMVPTSQIRPTLTIPKDAIKRSATGEFVYFDAGGVSGLAPIVQLFATGDRVAVQSEALRPGVRVVVQGNERMRPGQRLAELPDRELGTIPAGSPKAPVAEGAPIAPADRGG